MSRAADMSGPGAGASAPTSSAGRVTFQEVFLKSLEQVSQLDQQTQTQIADGLTGDDMTQAEILISMRKTELAYKTLMQIRNKLVDAYQEIQQLRI